MLTQYNGVINKVTHRKGCSFNHKTETVKDGTGIKEGRVEMEDEEKRRTLPLHQPFC